MSSTLRQRPQAKAQPESHSHAHSHGADEASALLLAIQGSTDRGSRITLIGLASNVALTMGKGVAGYTLGSAALLADAVHSASDLGADVVTLSTFRYARKPRTNLYPYGFGKFESLGSAGVSLLLIATALGIGLHSYELLMSTLASVVIQDEEATGGLAMVVATVSVAIKEVLYRKTLKVAQEENSNVLLANALHHRSDAYSSAVALGAIAGTWLGHPILDPLGGLFVSGLILKSGVEVGISAFNELVDKTADDTLAPKIFDLLCALRSPTLPPLPALFADHVVSETPTASQSLPILAVSSIRVFSSGPSTFIDLNISLPKDFTLIESNEVTDKIKRACENAFGGVTRVREVRIIVTAL